MQAFAGQVQAAQKVSYSELGAAAAAGVVVGDDKEKTLESGDVSYEANDSNIVYGVLATDGATITANQENINITAENTGTGYVAGVSGDLQQTGDKYTDAGHVVLGEEGVTKNITITAVSAGNDAVGLEVIRNVYSDSSTSAEVAAAPGSVVVNGENLVINAQSEEGKAIGVWVQNNTGGSVKSKVTINAENTVMDLTSANGTTGFTVMSSGELEVNSNLKVKADDIILTRGNSKIEINTDGSHSAQLEGNINFNYDQVTSGTVIDSTVDMNLSGEDSYWNGNTIFSWTAKSAGDKPSEDKLAVNSLHLTISDGAQWTAEAVEVEEGATGSGNESTAYGATQYVEANHVTLNGGIINIEGEANQGEDIHTGITIGNLDGTGGTINLEADDNFTTRQLEILSAGSDETGEGAAPTALSVNFTGINADDITDAQKNMESLASNVKFGTSGQSIADGKLTATANVAEGLISGAITGEMVTDNTASGSSIVAGSVKQAKSTSTMDNMKNIAAVSIAAWRQEDSTLSQRLGDLRETTGGQGIWARVSRGEFEYSGEFKNQYNYFQIGWDMAKDDWHYGAAVSYNDGETAYSAGHGENSSTSLSLYGTRLLNDGQYFDLVLKAGRLTNKYDNYAEAGHTHGDYDAWGTEISGEYGKKIDLSNDWFVTPQAQLSLMRIGSEDYTTDNGIHVDQDTLYSAVGRIGAEAGKKTHWGSLYAKASILHDFAGDADTYLTYQGMSNSYSQDIGDTWYEAGFGANWKMSASSYLYVDVVRTFGGDIKTPWQWNAGVRWGF